MNLVEVETERKLPMPPPPPTPPPPPKEEEENEVKPPPPRLPMVLIWPMEFSAPKEPKPDDQKTKLFKYSFTKGVISDCFVLTGDTYGRNCHCMATVLHC